MTPEDAKEWLRSLRKAIGQPEHRSLWHFEQAIDEINKLLEKQIPKKPIDDTNPCDFFNDIHCPVCKKHVTKNYKYCKSCGQALDWSSEDESIR